MQKALKISWALGALMTVIPLEAHALPRTVQSQLDDLLSFCRSAGGKPTVGQAAVTKAALTDDSFSDYIIWSGEIECRGALTAFGGSAGQTLILVPSQGNGVRQVPAQSWRLTGDGPMTVEVTGGFDCAAGHRDRCTQRLRWDGKAFASVKAATDSVATTGSSPRSIVGDWAETPEGCSSPMAGLVRIGSKSLTTDELSCSFRDVSRSGSTVTWSGSCSEGGRSKPARVTATESAGRLTIRFAGGESWNPLMRCRK